MIDLSLLRERYHSRVSFGGRRRERSSALTIRSVGCDCQALAALVSGAHSRCGIPWAPHTQRMRMRHTQTHSHTDTRSLPIRRPNNPIPIGQLVRLWRAGPLSLTNRCASPTKQDSIITTGDDRNLRETCDDRFRPSS
jgi:hypothetical protein